MKKLPDYKKIYRDMIQMKYPEKEDMCTPILNKEHISVLDIIKLNDLLTGNRERHIAEWNQKLKSYDRSAIFEILDYQNRHKLNNSQLARHFKLSRNTVTKWKRMFFSNSLSKSKDKK